MSSAKNALLNILSEWVAAGSIPEVDWKTRMLAIDFQEIIRTREATVKRLPTYKCKECPEFDDHVRFVDHQSYTEVTKD